MKDVQKEKVLLVFDFDDTLVKTDSRVFLIAGPAAPQTMTPAQFSSFAHHPDNEFDFKEFRQLINPRPIIHVNAILRDAYLCHGAESIVVLSARSVSDPIQQYIASIGMSDIAVIALDSADPQMKASWVNGRLSSGDIDVLVFFDDSLRNIVAISMLQDLHPHVRIDTRHIVV